MRKKIVIDKEYADFNTTIQQLIKEGKATEIDTDQSIEERAKSIFFKHNKEHIAMNSSINSSASDCIEAMKELATEQDLISKAREKGDFYCGHAGEVICAKQCEGCKRESQFD